MEITIKAEPKDLIEIFQKGQRVYGNVPELNFSIRSEQWETQRELIKKISAEYSGNCKLRISANTIL